MKRITILLFIINCVNVWSQSDEFEEIEICISDLSIFKMYKNGILYVDDFFEKKSNFRELGAHCNTVQAYINTDRTYMKYFIYVLSVLM